MPLQTIVCLLYNCARKNFLSRISYSVFRATFIVCLNYIVNIESCPVYVHALVIAVNNIFATDGLKHSGNTILLLWKLFLPTKMQKI